MSPGRTVPSEPDAGPTANRPRPEDFLELVQKGKRGRLKLYIGFAAGVGKTYRMLEEAHALKKRGVDVVRRLRRDARARGDRGADRRAGGRPAPQDRVPRRHRRGDEPRRHPRRNPARGARRRAGAHQRARAAATASATRTCSSCSTPGINVIGAFNVQHLESLNDLVERATGVGVRETVPDSFLKQADQVVNLDLAVEDLQERLRAGKIYAADKIPWALEHFFKDAEPRPPARAGAARGGRERRARQRAPARRRGRSADGAAAGGRAAG